jgi:ERCC4-related helicase
MEPTNVNESQAIDIVAEAEAEAEPLNNENNNHNDDWKNVRSFFLAPSVSANELERTTPVVEQAVIQMVQRMESSDAVQAYCQYQSEKQQDRLDQRNKQSAKREQALREAVVAGDARPYQTALLERAMERNSIVHLGTGAGKTLIALLLVQHYAADFLLSKPKQTLFLVPSVALALQQSTTLAANLPYTVGLACYSVTTSVAARQKLKDCHILVATHGACLDLLAHYADLFHMSNFNLVVLDECHYCTGNHDYAVIMRDYFHTTTPKDRPRILGLTASPLINVKVNHSDAQLLEQLSMLEATLDARIIPLADLVVSDPKNSSNESDNDDTNVHDDEKDTTNLYQKEADETTVTYLGNSASRLGLPPLPVSDDLELHPTRRKEFRQLEQLYDDLGPVALSIYSSALVEELSRNTYEKESSEQFARAVMYLTTITDFCHDTTTSAANDPDKNSRGRTDKLQKLEALLEREMEMRPDAVGLVFVERRVTAMALHHYFQNRRRSPNATMLHANATPKPLLATATTSGNQGGDAGSNPAPKQAESLIAATTATNSGNHGEYPGSAPAPKQACDFDQFADASDDDGNEEEMDCDSNTFPETATHTGSVDVDHFMDVDEGADQFDDAEDDPSFPMADVPSLRTNTPVDDSSSTMTTTIPVFVPSPRTTVPVERSREIPAPTRERVRSGVLVRKPTQLFKILNKGGRQPNLAEQEEARKTWLHQEANIRSVLSDLRRGDINILIATSVVEEGVDVQACSFVLVFDTLKNIKSYIQMKGRARQKDAKFFVFQDSNFAPKSNISLSTAQEMESRVHRFISSRSDTSEEHKIQYSEMRGGYQGDSLSCELQAVEAGIYKARHGTVSLLSAKSLLNRYAMAQPMDPIAHSSRAALTAYLPLYKEFQLVLPSYLSSSLRLVSLPERYRSDSNKSRENAMALMACVRLHKHGLLSERLLPLSRDEIHGRIFQLDESETKRDVIQPQDCSESKYTKAADVFIYQVHQESETLKEFQKCLGFEGLTVAIVAFGPLGEIETYRQGHPQLGEVVCSFDRPEKSTCTQSEKDILTEFFALVMNSRWRRRTRDAYFRGHTVDNERFIPPYFIACTKATGELDWDLMQHLLAESNRTRNEKIDAVRELSDMEALPAPRLWSPQYDETAIYIAYGPSGQLCDSPFPFKKEGITTYKDYFQIHHQFEVPADSQLFIAQRLWELPSRSIDVSGLKQPRRDLSEPDMDHSERYQPCENLARVKLPKHACLEPPLANAAVLLVCTMVPQLLYHMERTLVAKAFIAHCHTNLPILGACLAGLSISKVVAVLTANSCGEDDSYERLEWLGDAVLKLVQTDALIKSIDHSVWMENLHEGDLSCVRSGKILLYGCYNAMLFFAS